MDKLMQDLRYGARMLWKSPSFTLIAVLTLALGIGANSGIFSVVNSVLLRSLPYPESDRLMMLWQANETVRTNPVSYLALNDWRQQSHSFEYLSAHMGRWSGPTTVIGGSEPVRAYTTGVLRDFFEVFQVSPVIGRWFSSEESNFGTAPVAVVSHRFWQRSLGSERELTNQKLTIDGISFQVIGVMPPYFDFPHDTDVWVSRDQLYRDSSVRSSHNYVAVARLKPGVTLQQAQTEMSAIASRIVAQDPSDKAYGNVLVVSIKDQLTASIRPALLLLLAAVALMLLIACANVANLLLARSTSRRKEFAIRAALGAGRSALIRQGLTESVLLALMGGLFGLLIAYWFISVLIWLGPTTLPRLNEVSIDGRTLAFTMFVSFAASLLCGLVPSWYASRPDLNESLKEGGRGATAGATGTRNILVIAEITVTLVLLVGAGLLLKSLWRVMHVDPGFDQNNVLTIIVSLPKSEYPDNARKIGFYNELLPRLQAIPGVEFAGMINELPMSGIDINGQLAIAGRTQERFGYASFRVVAPDYFRAMRIPLLKGRFFNDQDNDSGEPVAIISQRAAETTFKGEDPVGQRVRSSNDITSREEIERTERWPKIVGIVGDVKHFGLETREPASLYVCYMQRPARIGVMTIVVRTKTDLAGIAAVAQQQIKSINGNLPVASESMEEVFSRSTATRRYNVILLGAFAIVALLLAGVGIYGVISFAVSQSTRELGIRMALGAQAADVLKLVVGHGMRLSAVGVAVGLVGAFAFTRWMQTLLFEVTATDPMIFAGVSLILIVVALSACYIPARRATKVDPLVALRHE